MFFGNQHFDGDSESNFCDKAIWKIFCIGGGARNSNLCSPPKKSDRQRSGYEKSNCGRWFKVTFFGVPQNFTFQFNISILYSPQKSL